MRVLLTGATGFVGRHVAHALRARGHAVLGLVRDPSRADDLSAAGVELSRGDMLEPASYAPLVAEVDAVVHTAQRTPKGRLNGRALRDIRAADRLMTGALATACAAHCRRLVYTSGCFNYGNGGDRWITEETPFDPSPLGVGHAELVTDLARRHRDDGLDVVSVAPGFVYGPGGLFKSAFFDQLEQNRLRVIGRGENYWSPVHVGDLATGYVAALEVAESGDQFNLVDDAPLTLRELVDTITVAAGHERVGTVPPALMGLLIGRPLVQSLTTSFRIRNDHARSALDWTPRRASFADGLPETLHALRAG